MHKCVSEEDDVSLYAVC